MESDRLTTEEVANRERVTARTVRKMCERGDLPAYKMGGVWRIDDNYRDMLAEKKAGEGQVG